MTTPTSVTVEKNGRILSIASPGKVVRFHAIWLRDNSPDATTRDPANRQKLITINQLPTTVAISAAELTSENTVSITFEPEQLTATYELSWLLANAYDHPRNKELGWIRASQKPWRGDHKPFTAAFTELADDRATLRDWLSAIRRDGFACVEDGPTEPEILFKIVELFGYVRETNYGRLFEVRTEVEPTNLAFTGLGLQGHTDNPYRDPTPTLQLLYCLENSTDGGLSLVIDGFAAAQRLRDEMPEGFELLARYNAAFRYQGLGGVDLEARYPMIELEAGGALRAIRFNNRSIDTATEIPFEHMEAYYAAYRRFAEIIDDPEMAVSFKLEPGGCFIVDNRRVLHSRTGFSSAGSRWLQGCYADRDGLLSTLSVLEQELGPAQSG